jgi:hypothetical protein
LSAIARLTGSVRSHGASHSLCTIPHYIGDMILKQVFFIFRMLFLHFLEDFYGLWPLVGRFCCVEGGRNSR